MDGVGALNPIDVAAAEIQKQVGKFLGLKSRINMLRVVNNLTIAGAAEQLYQRQNKLESRLSPALDKIEQMKTGSWTFGGVIDLGTVAYEIATQIQDVEKLEKKARTAAAYQGSEATFGEWALSPLVVGGGLALLGVWWMSHR